MKRTSLSDQMPDGSGITDDRTKLAYSASVLAEIVRAHHMPIGKKANDERERLYQAALDSPAVCDALDNLLHALGNAWHTGR